MSAARWPKTVGVSMLPGSLTRERVKFWLSPMMTPSAKAVWIAAWSASGGAARVNDCDAQVLAVAAIGVRVEIADEGAFVAARAQATAGQPSDFGQSENQFADAAGLGEADGGSGGIADAMHCRFSLLAQPDDEQSLWL